jgi:hypothetical protein
MGFWVKKVNLIFQPLWWPESKQIKRLVLRFFFLNKIGTEDTLHKKKIRVQSRGGLPVQARMWNQTKWVRRPNSTQSLAFVFFFVNYYFLIFFKLMIFFL